MKKIYILSLALAGTLSASSVTAASDCQAIDGKIETIDGNLYVDSMLKRKYPAKEYPDINKLPTFEAIFLCEDRYQVMLSATQIVDAIFLQGVGLVTTQSTKGKE